MGKLTQVKDATFDEEVRRSSMPVIVDFWAPWCGPCKAVTPILESLAEKYKNQVKFVSMNVEEDKSAVIEYAVRSIPTLLFFKGGIVKNQLIGAQNKANIEKAVKNLL
jgi:thioredoxin 1